MKNFGILKMVSSAAAIAILGAGCAQSPKINPTSIKDTNLTEAILEKNTQLQLTAKENIEKEVMGAFYQTSVYSAVKQLAEQIGIQVDQSFIPSEKYRVSIDVNGSMKDFLSYTKQATSIDYRFRNGKLVVHNKDLIEPSIAGKQCSVNQEPTVAMSFKDMRPAQVFKYFSDNYGMNFVYKTKYSDFTLTEGPQPESGVTLPKAAPVSLQYKGCDPKEALRIFLSANNLVAEEVVPGSYNIMDYEVANIDVPVYFDYKFTSTSGVGGSSSSSSSSSAGSTGSTGGSGGVAGGQVTIEESQKKELTNFITRFIGPKGKVNVSNRGFVTIEDTPENVRVAKRLIMKEIAKQKPLELQVSVFRIDLSSGTQVGVDWNAVIGNGIGLGAESIGIATNYASNFSGGGAFTLNSANNSQLIRALETVGNTKIVREYRTKTKAGILNTFKAVEEIPYVTTTTTSSTAGFQTNVEAKVAEAGLIINILPAFDHSGEQVDLSTNIVVSEYLGDKSFQMSSGTFTLPRIATNEVKIPAKVNLGQTMVLTGFKVSKNSKESEGVPGLIRLPWVAGLAGMDTQDNGESEFIIVITPREVEEA